jgi:hypothetical protein
MQMPPVTIKIPKLTRRWGFGETKYKEEKSIANIATETLTRDSTRKRLKRLKRLIIDSSSSDHSESNLQNDNKITIQVTTKRFDSVVLASLPLQRNNNDNNNNSNNV